jgi:hypothetical protein
MEETPYKLDTPWDPMTLGFVEADTVAHCGGKAFGDYAWSLTLTEMNDLYQNAMWRLRRK